MNFTKIIIHGLRWTTDAIRGVIERNRGDMIMALGQTELKANPGE
jgi:hypothetical protein